MLNIQNKISVILIRIILIGYNSHQFQKAYTNTYINLHINPVPSY